MTIVRSIHDYENRRGTQQDAPPSVSDEQETKRFTHDYPNDTVLEFSRSGNDSTLRLSFTSEDRDLGTEELMYHGENGESLRELADGLKAEIKAYLDLQDSDSFLRQQGLQNEIHSMEDLYGEYSRTALYAFENALNQMQKEEVLTVPWQPIELQKTDMLYSFVDRDEIEKGCVGHLRGDFGRDGDEFWTSWFDHQPQLQRQDFKDELQSVVDALRAPKGLLQNFITMSRQCITGQWVQGCYGFRAESANYEYCLRCNPRRGDYNFYLYCYDKTALREQQKIKEEAMKPHKIKKNKEFER